MNIVCPLSEISVIAEMQETDDVLFVSYFTQYTGKIKIEYTAVEPVRSLNSKQKTALAGIARHHTLENLTIFTISKEILLKLDSLPVPKEFKEQAKLFLKHIYETGGSKYKSQQFASSRDSPLAYVPKAEFDSIMEFLKDHSWIKYDLTRTSGGYIYQNLLLTKEGIAEVEKEKPQMPMFGLVSQEITSGNAEVDAKINHARKLFFGENSKEIEKRSACEELCHILEPLRDNLKKIFSGDTETFFNLVNTFDVRHNKITTKQIEHEEQLEWIFYSLLNTINTYVKIKHKTKA